MREETDREAELRVENEELREENKILLKEILKMEKKLLRKHSSIEEAFEVTL